MIDLSHHFLIAMPAMGDPYFEKALVYIAEHNAEGAIGLIVNRTIDLKLADFLDKIALSYPEASKPALMAKPIHFGGPVQVERGFVLHRPLGRWQSTFANTGDIGLTSSRDVLQAVAEFLVPRDIIVALGYSGWGAGQLEKEIQQNAWLSLPADPSLLFDIPPEERWLEALDRLGVKPAHLSHTVGHA